MDKLANSLREAIAMPVRRVGGTEPTGELDRVAPEEPLEIRLSWCKGDEERCTQSLSVTMRSPDDDKDLVAGFLATEGIVSSVADIATIETVETNIVQVTLDDEVQVDIGRAQRNFFMTSSCGICGKASLESLKLQSAFAIGDTGFRIESSILAGLPALMESRQTGFAATGGMHAAAAFSSAGHLLAVSEDIGRHNAVDKIIGSIFLDGGLPMSETGLLVSGRASFEIMQKAMMAGCPFVAAVGAASDLAIDVAWEFGMTLVAFLRDGRFSIYAGPRRIA